jgi:hypothetical protein
MDKTLIDIIHYNNRVIDYLLDKEIITYGAKERLEIYTYYHELIGKGEGKMDAFTQCSIKFNKSEESIKKIIYCLNKETRLCTN